MDEMAGANRQVQSGARREIELEAVGQRHASPARERS